ncbi:MAG: hypothetical protein N3E45_02505 [Oscillatoriaceae bacterium SKW80]|nr:hypothetical protein [Oscillatoriaceae bacterium SKW80]
MGEREALATAMKLSNSSKNDILANLGAKKSKIHHRHLPQRLSFNHN